MSRSQWSRIALLLCVLAFGLALLNACNGGGNGSPQALLENTSDCNDPLSDTFPCSDDPGDDTGGGPGDDDGGPGDDDGGPGDDGGDDSGDDGDESGDDPDDEDSDETGDPLGR